ncbi:hypothetical protein MXD81_58190 [Microbacteriaceae bacterium K1510]|nr:hypothetical protein [Microbacteriaceae bacterium K1510]
MRSLYVVAPLFALLIAAIWFLITAWNHIGGPDVPFYGWVAIGGGAFFSLLVGSGLMALLFYSSRKGYDDQAAKHFNKHL